MCTGETLDMQPEELGKGQVININEEVVVMKRCSRQNKIGIKQHFWNI